MGLIYVILPVLIYIGVLAGFVYAIYRMVDAWVEKSVSVRREQNALLGRLIEKLDRKGGDTDPDNTKNETL